MSLIERATSKGMTAIGEAAGVLGPVVLLSHSHSMLCAVLHAVSFLRVALRERGCVLVATCRLLVEFGDCRIIHRRGRESLWETR